MIRIVIVDDHDLMREGIRAILEQDPIFQIVGETGDGQEAIRMATRLRPDVLLMDVSLPGGIGGLEATEAIVADCPGVKVIILTQYEHREYIKRAMRIGARGYLLKRSVAAQLKDAIKTVHLGQAASKIRVTPRRGSAIAQNRLARILMAGRGMPANPTEAVKWHIIAKAAGASDPELDLYAGKQTQAVRDAAQQAATKWLSTQAALRP